VLTEKEIRAILEEAKALKSGHFQLSSGRHSQFYLQCALALQFPDKAEKLGKALGELCDAHSAGGGDKIHAVVSPAVGGVVMGQEVARAIGTRSIFAERDAAGKMVLRRGFDLKRGENVLLVDDVLTTGGSLRELFSLVQSYGARVIGIGALAERGFHDKTFEVTRDVLLKLNFEDFDPQDCPACKEGLPIDKPGSRPAVNA
jgi:orotate phosphoribosyltransferase